MRLLPRLACVASCVCVMACSKSETKPSEPAPTKPSSAPPVSPHGSAHSSPHGSAHPPPTTNRPPKARTTPAGPNVDLGGLKLSAVPAAWTPKPLTMSMRRAHWEVAPTGKDKEPASVVVFFFGKGQGGSIDANVKRWLGQFDSEDGKPIDKTATVKKNKYNGLAVTVVDATGRYRAPVRPSAQERHDKSGYRMIAAIVEAPAGSFYFKVLGPKATVAALQPDLQKVLASVRP